MKIRRIENTPYYSDRSDLRDAVKEVNNTLSKIVCFLRRDVCVRHLCNFLCKIVKLLLNKLTMDSTDPLLRLKDAIDKTIAIR